MFLTLEETARMPFWVVKRGSRDPDSAPDVVLVFSEENRPNRLGLVVVSVGREGASPASRPARTAPVMGPTGGLALLAFDVEL